MRKIIIPVLFIVIIFFAYVLRSVNINSLPATLNPDEAALGYNAFSILKTGADEHGAQIPLALQSFGDWKLPVYSYLDTIPLGIFGISKLSIRLPSIIAGTVSVVLAYFIALKLFKKKGLALLASLIFAINPWSIFFSRGAYEVNVATAIFLGGALLLLHSLGTKKAYLFLFSAFLFGLSMFTYHTYIVFTPLFVFSVLFFFRDKYSITRYNLFAFCILLLIIIFSFVTLSQGGNKKATNLNVFNDKEALFNRADKLRGDNSLENKELDKVIYNKYSAGFYQFTLNYLNAYSPSVLFDKGGERLTHNIGDIGFFYIIDSAFFITGLFFLIWKKDKKSLLFLIPWLILAPIPSAITREHTGTRLFTLVPPMILVSSYGLYNFFEVIKARSVRWVAIGIMSLLICLSFTYFANYYFVHFNTQRMLFWKYGYEDAVKLSQKYPDYKVVMRGPENFPYIYFLLYESYDPNKFRKEVVYYPETPEGFVYVKSFGRYEFVNEVDYNKQTPKTLYIDDINKTNGLPGIRLPNGDVVMKYYINP